MSDAHFIDFLDDFQLFDPDSMEWIEITELVQGNLPSGRYDCSLANVNETLYFFGGRDYSGGSTALQFQHGQLH